MAVSRKKVVKKQAGRPYIIQTFFSFLPFTITHLFAAFLYSFEKT
jgi:hypothetical protein